MKNRFGSILTICLRIGLVLAAVLLFNNSLYMSSYSNFNIGLVLVAVIGLIFLLYGIFFVQLSRVKWLNYLVLAGFIVGCGLMGFIGIYGKSETVTYEEDALIVLGAAVRGEIPSYPLYSRLEVAVAYHAKNPQAVIVVSGGQGYQEDITEALAMERHLLRRGVPQNKIIKEEQATSTYENFKYSKELLDDHFDHPYQVAIVTSDFHIFRARRVAGYFGYNPTHLPAPIQNYTIPNNYLRECAAVMRELVIGRRLAEQ